MLVQLVLNQHFFIYIFNHKLKLVCILSAFIYNDNSHMETNFNKKIRKRKKVLKAIVISLSSLSFFFLAFYLLVSLIQNPNFIVRDLQEKYARVAGTSSAMNLNVHFTGPPSKPVLTATPGCSPTNPYVDLNWNATSDTTDYDIQRDSLPLINNLTNTHYQDDAVNNSTTYAYKVIASGPLGNTGSDPVSATTGDCTLNVPVTCKIQNMNDKPLSSYDGTPTTKDRFPKFSGNSNTPNALISIFITGETSVISNIVANINGYWKWETPFKLNYGSHNILVMATDPLNSLRYGSDSLLFKIEEEETVSEKKEETVPPAVEIPGITLPQPRIIPPEETEKISVPMALNVTVVNPEKKIYSGQNVSLETGIIHYNNDLKNFDIQYEISDSNGNVIKSFEQNISSSGNETIKKEISLPSLSKTGKYKIIAKTFYGGFNISSEDYFFLVERPVVNLGGGFIFTLTELLQNISWLIFILLLLLLFFLLMLSIERYLSEKALFQITEDFLRKKGFFGKREGGAE